MEKLEKQVARARRRILFQQFAGSLPWCWFAALAAAAILIGVDKFRPLGIDPWITISAAIGIGAAAAVGWTAIRRRSKLDAAIEIDRRFALKERVSSAWALEGEHLESDAGQAVIRDAARRLDRISLDERFTVRLNRWALLPIVPAAAALLIALFVTPLSEQTAGAKPADHDVKKQIKNSTDELRRRLVKRRQQAEEQGLEDMERLLERIERGSEDLARGDQSDRKKALIKLNDLARQLKEKREAMASSKGIQQQLNQLKNLQQGPANNFSKALQQGDFNRAMQELDKLAKQMQAGDLDPDQREKLAKQLGEMRDKLQQMADAHKQMQKQLEKQLDEALAAGRKDEANRIQEQLNQLAQQAPNMKFMEKLAQQLGNAANNMKNGATEAAMGDLQALQGQLAQLQQQLDQMELMEAALDEIAMAKDAMNCAECEGQGCAECQGNGLMAGFGMGEGMGDGLGEGRGRGARPEEKTETNSYDSRVKQKMGRGQATFGGFVDGPNKKGQVKEEIATEFESAASQAADPLTNQRLPRAQREHAKDYLQALREGKR